MSVLAALGRIGVGYLAATAIAVECAVLHNFLWHERLDVARPCATRTRGMAASPGALPPRQWADLNRWKCRLDGVVSWAR